MLLIKMALRNLTRHKRRVVAIAIILAIGISIYLTIDSLMSGLTGMALDNLIELETGHLQLVTSQYWDEKDDLPLDNLINWDQELNQVIRELDAYQAAVRQLKFSAKLNNGIDELPVTGYGIDIEGAQEVFKTTDYIIEGSYFTANDYQAVLGRELANLMDLAVEDYLTLLVKTNEGTFNTVDVEIMGLLNTQNPDVNSNFIYLPLNIAQQTLNLEGKVSQVIVSLQDINQTEQTVKDLNQRFKGANSQLEVHSWRDSAETVIAMNRAQSMETGVMMFMVLMIAAIGIVNTVILSALERNKEIGMMKALGFKKNEIVSIFMIEAAGIGTVGGIIGLLLSAVSIYYLTATGINLTQLIGGESFGMPIVGRLYGTWNPLDFIVIFIAGIILSTLASIPPAYWAAKKDPVDSINSK